MFAVLVRKEIFAFIIVYISRKELLVLGMSARLLGNRTERELLARSPESVGLAIR
jgi:hypothetical protein